MCIYINIYIPLYVTYKCTNTLLHTCITSILNVYLHTPLKCMCMQLITHEHTATHIYLKLIVCRYLSAACWPGAEPLRFRLVDSIQAGVQPQYICYFLVRKSSYRPVEADKVPCQGIDCLPSGNASGITPTILSYEMKTKTVCIAKLRETLKE